MSDPAPDPVPAGSTELAFWDARYEGKAIAAAAPDDPVLRAALAHFGDVRGLHVCDLGSGTGEFALAFLRAGARVTAIDQSEAATRRLSEIAAREGLEGLRVVHGDACRLGDWGPYDRVFGALILHHLEPFPTVVEALTRALAPGGKAFFHENNAGIGAPALWFRQHLAGRLWFPKHGDAQEHPLTPAELRLLRTALEVRVAFPELALFRLVSHYVFRDRCVPALFRWLDEVGYAWPPLRRYSYFQYLYVSVREP
ncbi:MAG: class I SAM-dependent methyltransferase [Candidatus Sericytochromatia bacterium]|nr:class I SAM-dependent methyltransferase [Candidatus Sericytochromatia bacterium]